MAKITVTSANGFDINSFNFVELYNGEDYKTTSTLFRVEYSDGEVDEFLGNHLHYNKSGEPTAGTVTGYVHLDAGGKVVTAAGLHIAATKIGHAAQTASASDDDAVVQAALKGHDSFKGAGGDDTLSAYKGNDTLLGEGGSDVLDGGLGNDIIGGGKGDDTMTGGAGDDRFIFETGDSIDKITDFRSGHDKINLKHLKGIDDFKDLKAHHLAMFNDNLMIQQGSDTLMLEHTSMSDIHAHDFIF